MGGAVKQRQFADNVATAQCRNGSGIFPGIPFADFNLAVEDQVDVFPIIAFLQKDAPFLEGQALLIGLRPVIHNP